MRASAAMPLPSAEVPVAMAPEEGSARRPEPGDERAAADVGDRTVAAVDGAFRVAGEEDVACANADASHRAAILDAWIKPYG